MHLSATFAGDLIMTLTTAYFLIRSKANVLPQYVVWDFESVRRSDMIIAEPWA